MLSIAHDEDVAHLGALVDDPGTEAVLCLVPLGFEPAAAVQALWHRVAERRFVLVLRHSTLWPGSCDGRGTGALAAPHVLAAVSAVARWTATHESPGLRLMTLEPATDDLAATPHDRSEMHGLTIRGNVVVHTTTEGITMTIAPDDPFAVPEPGTDPVPEPGTDPDVQPIEPDDPDDVPEVPLEPTPAPDETGIR